MKAKQVEEKKKKAEERAKKQLKHAAEREKRAAEKEELKSQKMETRKGKKAKISGDTSTGIQSQEISSNECAVCFGTYEDDIDESEEPLRNWVQCTSPECLKWMHEECLEKDEDECMICLLCCNLFK